MDKNKIYKTTDYSLFKYLKGNRAITELHVRRLVESIKEKDLQVPIIVDEKMNVVEGQHRLEAYKIVGRPILYIVKDNVTLEDVRKLNSVARKWTLTEYLMSHVKLGNHDYELLEWFHRTYEFGLSECIAMLNDKGYCASKELKEFVESDEDLGEIMDMAYRLEGLTRNVGRHAGGVVISPGDLLSLFLYT